jgi:hypothetical protein
MIEAAPVLDEARQAEARPSQEAGLRRRRPELFQHPRHRRDRRHPLVELPRLVDPHSDEEDDEIAFRLRRGAVG